jgi:hypothetical protein
MVMKSDLEKVELSKYKTAYMDIRIVRHILHALEGVSKSYAAYVSSDDMGTKSLKIKGIIVCTRPGDRHVEFVVEGGLHPFHGDAIYKPLKE